MDATTLLNLIAGGETSRLQLKENIFNVVSAAQEMVAFANSKGGTLLIGISDKTGAVVGLTFPELQRVQSLLTTAANEHVKSPLIIETEVVDVEGKKVIVANIPEGTHKPHTDKDGLIFIKNGADKRKVSSHEALARLLQSSGNLYADRALINGSGIKDLDTVLFREFYEKKFRAEIDTEDIPRLLENLALSKSGVINLTANLLFGKKPQILSPDCYITAIWFAGNDLAGSQYLSSENIGGDMAHLFKGARHFVMSCLHKLQNGKDFNTAGDPEIPQVVFDELIMNALIHRDYFIHDSIKLFVFDNRIEIKSPGTLPNSLTINEIKHGVSRRRNHLLAAYAFDVLPYRGAGSGILRALLAYPEIEFINDTDAEQVTAIIYRKQENGMAEK